MVNSENSVRRVTRAAKRKNESSLLRTPQGNKRRVVLGELTNLPSSPSSSCRYASSKAKQKRSKPAKNTGSKPVSQITVKAVDHKKKYEPNADSEDPQMCASFASEIYCYLRKLEADPSRIPRSDYLESVQNDVTSNMRGILIDWLVEVADEYRLLSETLYLTVNYIDRYLSTTILHRQKLQLLGVSAMLVASRKYEEIDPPNVDKLCYITDNTYTKQEVMKMESDILNVLKFEVGNPTTKTFLQKLVRVAQNDFTSAALELEFLCCYLADLSLLDYNLVKFLPSMIAASVILLARYVLRSNEFPWNTLLEQQSGYKAVDLKHCVLALFDFYVAKREGLSAVKDKYKQHKFKWVSLAPSPEDIPSLFFENFNPNNTL